MPKKNGYEGSKIVHLKKFDIFEQDQILADVESTDNLVERMEVNAQTFKYFRRFPQFEFSSPRDCRRGFFGRLYVADVWLNNKLKDGQEKIFWTKIEAEVEEVKVLAEENRLED